MADQKNKMLRALDKIAAWASPTIDATPGRETFEDKIDRFIFDPQSGTAPLELLLLGSGKAGVQALKAAGMKSRQALHAAEDASPLFRKSMKIARRPRKEIEGLIGKAVRANDDKAVAELQEALYKLPLEEKLELFDKIPGARYVAYDWDSFARYLYYEGDPKIARQFLSKSAKARDLLASAASKGVGLADIIYPKARPKASHGPTVPAMGLENAVVGYLSARNKARKLTGEE